ncbi:Multifunctional conjugation protein TraI [Pseudovibrio axinellae]|uniref:Multifunctional conjugation protein TraI n=1 Tax=Pseudovibrio axinellae TaxID=989403 RepID=A0A165Z6D4_9HYPH|nr:MobF family relaxase [Pseudovibrio axinellae]KZL19551.1 Multifunctional conjugation protein TraI [Pseudovibrio axinellae]SEQ31598.1 conjugative relaxase domain-containing protein, TrwC/TraI family [Pseudovibrio axinellae]
MVATIAARGNAVTAAHYYLHLESEPYYTEGNESSGLWLGKGAEALDLQGSVSKEQFAALLHGLHPQTQERLAVVGGKKRTHTAGHDLVFSAPKSVSVLWALTAGEDRSNILKGHQRAVAKALSCAEENHVICRRGKGGRIKENVAGMVAARFQHFSSRDLDPQLHTHCYIFNVAQRQDTTWGAILSKPLYQVQKQLGAQYRKALAEQLVQLGYEAEVKQETIQISGVSREAELSFSKRRLEILQAARLIQNRTASQMELIALKTRKRKRELPLPTLFQAWQARAKKLEIKVPAPRIRQDQALITEPTSPQRRFDRALKRLNALTAQGATQRPLSSTVKLLRAAMNKLGLVRKHRQQVLSNTPQRPVKVTQDQSITSYNL